MKKITTFLLSLLVFGSINAQVDEAKKNVKAENIPYKIAYCTKAEAEAEAEAEQGEKIRNYKMKSLE